MSFAVKANNEKVLDFSSLMCYNTADKKRTGDDAMKKKEAVSFDTRKIVYLSVLTALMLIFNLIPLRLGGMSLAVFSLTVMITGIIKCGFAGGVWLGAAFGISVMLMPETTIFISISFIGTLITVMTKGIVAGLAAALVYKVIDRFNRYAAIISAAAVAPTVNSTIFFIGSMIFFRGYFEELSQTASMSVVPFVILVVIGINYLIELAVSVIFSPVVYKLAKMK